ncbi:MAG: CPBP family intramembrane metalloprotease [Acidobacteria bacterium]|nr:CPBP family intramembrane metalloprotease [Acidobacteriota bacterium]
MNSDLHNEEVESPSLGSPFTAVMPPPPANPAPTWNVPLAFFNWAGSIAFSLLIPVVLTLLYAGLFAPEIIESFKNGQLTMTKPLMLVQTVGIFGGQLLSLLLSWIIVTGMGTRSFKEALGLQWVTQFKLPHSIALGVGMFLLSIMISQLLPKHETDLDMFLKFGLVVRVGLAFVATIGAPIQEEIVYRGVLYSALEKSLGTRWSLILVSLLFWVVHIPQYWKSPATWVAVLILSFVLTGLRAWSGKLLPCVATHLFFNGIQGILIVFAPEKSVTTEPAAQPALFLWRALGL